MTQTNRISGRSNPPAFPRIFLGEQPEPRVVFLVMYRCDGGEWYFARTADDRQFKTDSPDVAESVRESLAARVTQADPRGVYEIKICAVEENA